MDNEQCAKLTFWYVWSEILLWKGDVGYSSIKGTCMIANTLLHFFFTVLILTMILIFIWLEDIEKNNCTYVMHKESDWGQGSEGWYIFFAKYLFYVKLFDVTDRWMCLFALSQQRKLHRSISWLQMHMHGRIYWYPLWWRCQWVSRFTMS